MYRENIRFINTFRDFDLLESAYLYCQECVHTGYRLTTSILGVIDQLDNLIIDRIQKAIV